MYTPGPWKATGTKALGLSEVIAPNADFHEGHLVASVNKRFYIDGGKTGMLPREQTDANARLLATAPSLLTACEHTLLLLERNVANGLPAYEENVKGVVDIMRKVISQAKGDK